MIAVDQARSINYAKFNTKQRKNQNFNTCIEISSRYSGNEYLDAALMYIAGCLLIAW